MYTYMYIYIYYVCVTEYSETQLHAFLCLYIRLPKVSDHLRTPIMSARECHSKPFRLFFHSLLT